jgi:diaminohydroxyphosphoribosylaminopyrimidine deaminase/5-amino-6-(5-phosphoribosylamino)uracil reductase
VKISNLSEAMKDLFSRGFISLMMESGSCLVSEFIKKGLVDRISLFQNPSFLGAGKGILGDLDLTSLNTRPKLTQIDSRWIGDDHFITGRLVCSQD